MYPGFGPFPPNQQPKDKPYYRLGYLNDLELKLVKELENEFPDEIEIKHWEKKDYTGTNMEYVTLFTDTPAFYDFVMFLLNKRRHETAELNAQLYVHSSGEARSS